MMTTEPIVESGLTFGPFPEGYCFHIEKSQTYRDIEKGLKTVEFLLLRPNNNANETVIWVVEAKKSSPSPTSNGKLEDRMNEVSKKLTVTVQGGTKLVRLRLIK